MVVMDGLKKSLQTVRWTQLKCLRVCRVVVVELADEPVEPR